MSKLLFLISLLSISCSAYPMLSKWDYPPVEIEYNLKRMEYDNVAFPEVDNRNIHYVIHSSNKYYQGPYSSCFEKAMHQTTGVVGLCGFVPGNNKYTSINVEKYFKQVPLPENGNLVIYTDSSTNRTMNHFGVIYDARDLLIESQWGKNEQCIIHKIDAVPFSYRKAVAFFDLKEEYKGKENKSILMQDINNDYIVFVAQWNKNQKKSKMIFENTMNEVLKKTLLEEEDFFRSLSHK